ncbi:MAG: ROK family protein [Treponema sp.]|jgi:glucokinase|nr:ROK family protein [Treponema sp.]
MPDREEIVLAVDIGGSKFITGLVRKDGTILDSKRCLWSENKAGKGTSAEGLIADIKPAIRSLLAANPGCKPPAMGAAIPGLADPEKGLWVESSFSGIRDLPFASIMEEEFRVPVHLDNDVRACALAERIWGCCSGNAAAGGSPAGNLRSGMESAGAVDDFLWITVSNGIGGCIFVNGKPYRGAGGNAGEIGHLIVEEGPAARPCKAGHAGCAEMHAAGPALVRGYLELGGNPVIGGEAATAKSIAALARLGDKAAVAAYDMEGLYLGRAIGAAVNLLSPAMVIIGGGVSLDFDLFKPSLEKSLAAHMYQNANPGLILRASPLGYNAALLGAAALGFTA